jgi:hypothetical protein
MINVGIQRTVKLEALLERLRRGEDVQNRDLETWLGEAEYANYLYERQTQQELRDELKNKPSEVREYERRLRLALLAYNKGEGASTRGKHVAAKRYFAEAETLFEHTLEYLQEIIQADRSLCVWFDRDTEWTIESEASIDPVSVPRVVTSRSLDNRGGGLTSRLQGKRDVKIAAVERALAAADVETGQDEVDLNAAQRAELERFLKLRDEL